jgi:hypothetical protein
VSPSRSAKDAFNPLAGASAMTCGVLIMFCFAIGAAMGAYPGGTHYDHGTVGYDFFRNFWCDTLRNPALNGAPNARGARLASMALWVLSSGLLPFWGVVAELAVPRKAARSSNAREAIRWLGMLAMVGTMGVTLLPSDRNPYFHGLLVTIAGPFGLLATTLALTRGWSSTLIPRAVSLLGVLAVLAALVNFGVYAREFWLSAPPSPLLPAIQKLATGLFLAWVLALSALAFSGRQRQPPPRRSRR